MPAQAIIEECYKNTLVLEDAETINLRFSYTATTDVYDAPGFAVRFDQPDPRLVAVDGKEYLGYTIPYKP